MLHVVSVKRDHKKIVGSAVDDDIKCCVAVERRGVFEESRQRNGSAQSKKNRANSRQRVP